MQPLTEGSQDKPQRLFLALWPDAAARERLAQHAQGWHWPGGCRRYAPADWHVTLHFIGAVPKARVPTISAGLQVPLTPFELVLQQPTLWPRGLAVLCPHAVPPALADLHARLGQALADLGLPVEPRAYQPHLTLARNASAAQVPQVPIAVAWTVRQYALVESTGDSGQRYRVLRWYGHAATQ